MAVAKKRNCSDSTPELGKSQKNKAGFL